MISALYETNMLSCILYSASSQSVGRYIAPLGDILFQFRTTQSLLLLLIAARFAEKQQISIA